jgi:lipopolysaccharide export LptBFGC system permease protein LptF
MAKMSKTPIQTKSAFQKSNRYSAAALVCLSLALLCLGIGVFITGPRSVAAIVFLCIGLLFVLCYIICFVLYSSYSHKEQRS